VLREYIKNRWPLFYGFLKRGKGRITAFLKKYVDPMYMIYRNRKLAREWCVCEGAYRKKVAEISRNKKIKIVFLIIHRSTWKFDNLFEAMNKENKFKPMVFVVKDISRRAMSSPKWSNEEFIQSYKLFESRGWDVFADEQMVENDNSVRSTSLSDLNPDIVILNNPHGLAGHEYSNDLVKKYLTCYIPYHFEGTTYNNNQDQYNSSMHNNFWKIYAPHIVSLEVYKKSQAIKAKNVTLTGHPFVDDLTSTRDFNPDPWKPQGKRKFRIIWAPHQVLADGVLPRSCFLDQHQFFLDLAKEFYDEVQWCFKPHPLLRPNLESHPDWGYERTKEYFSRWEDMENSQINTGSYVELFKYSDALIHDSYSFMIEYLFLNKPLVFLMRSDGQKNFLNKFGLEALSAHIQASSDRDICSFIKCLIEKKSLGESERREFLNQYWDSINCVSPSESIIKDLKGSLR